MSKRVFFALTLLLLSCPVIFTACGGSGNGSNGSSSVGDTSTNAAIASTPLDPAGDPDGDGLTNERELLYGTSPVLADTDGDGISDFDEIVKYGFDPDSDPLRFNPLVADVPQLGIVLRSLPVIELILTDINAVSHVIEVDRDQENALAIDQSITNSVVDTIALAQTATNATTFTGGVAGDPTISYDINKSMAEDVTFNFTKTQTVENLKAITEIESFSQTHEIDASGGVLRVVVGIENRGNLPFRCDHMVLSALIPDPSNPGKFYPVGNLVFDTSHNYTGFPSFTIPPGGSFPAIVFVNDVLDLDAAKLLLSNRGSLTISVASYELSDANGKPYAFNYTDIMARDALIVIDYAGLRNPERYFVATNSDPNNPGVTAGRAMRDILRIPFEAGPIDWGGVQKTGLLGLRNDPNVRAGIQKNGYWLCVHTRNNGLGNVATRYSMLEKDYDFENIKLRGGDTLYLVYMEDKDGDGIFSRQERQLGTSDLLVDSDGDGWSDWYEINVSHTNPNNPDTDGDGVIDSKDSAPLDPKVQ